MLLTAPITSSHRNEFLFPRPKVTDCVPADPDTPEKVAYTEYVSDVPFVILRDVESTKFPAFPPEYDDPVTTVDPAASRSSTFENPIVAAPDVAIVTGICLTEISPAASAATVNSPILIAPLPNPPVVLCASETVGFDATILCAGVEDPEVIVPLTVSPSL